MIEINEVKNSFIKELLEANVKGRFLRLLKDKSRYLRLTTAAALALMAVFSPPQVEEALAASADREFIGQPAYVASSGDKRKARLKGVKAADLAELLLDGAASEEAVITSRLQEFTNSEVKLVGLDNRLKSHASLTRKIESDAAEKKLDVISAAADIGDSLRYTLVADEDVYADTVNGVTEQLKNEGYMVKKFRNAWGGKFYQGVNMQFISPTGAPFEVQFHTPKSFEVKERSHAAYEIRRSDTATPAEKEAATIESIAMNREVKAPAGAKEIEQKTDLPLAV